LLNKFAVDCLDVEIIIMKYDPRQWVLCGKKDMMEWQTPRWPLWELCSAIDVFHIKSKHKESDDNCNCSHNPAMFPDLIVNNKWCFNSSTAEVTNAWFGGFQSIVWEMHVNRYNFFLDEMIKQRNQMIVADLCKCHAHPYEIPCSSDWPGLWTWSPEKHSHQVPASNWASPGRPQPLNLLWLTVSEDQVPLIRERGSLVGQIMGAV